MRRPEGSIIAAVIQDNVVHGLGIAGSAARIGVNRYLALVAAGVETVPIVVAVGIGAALAQSGHYTRHVGHAVIGKVLIPGRLGGRGGERQHRGADALYIIPGALIILQDVGLEVIGGVRRERILPANRAIEVARCGVGSVGSDSVGQVAGRGAPVETGLVDRSRGAIETTVQLGRTGRYAGRRLGGHRSRGYRLGLEGLHAARALLPSLNHVRLIIIVSVRAQSREGLAEGRTCARGSYLRCRIACSAVVEAYFGNR